MLLKGVACAAADFGELAGPYAWSPCQAHEVGASVGAVGGDMRGQASAQMCTEAREGAGGRREVRGGAVEVRGGAQLRGRRIPGREKVSSCEFSA